MKRASIISYGAIPIFKGPHGPEVLVLEQYGVQGTHWGFPKGKSAEGESPQETAIREAKEEVGVAIELLDEDLFSVTYDFSFEDTLVNKTVHYFLAHAKAQGLALQTAGVKDARWLPPEDVAARLSFDNTREMFATAWEHYQTNHHG